MRTFLLVSLLVGNVAHARCFVGTIMGSQLEGTEPDTEYEVLFTPPAPGGTGAMNLYVGSNEIAGSSVVEGGGAYRFENYDGFFAAHPDGSTLTLLIAGGTLMVNEAGELQIHRNQYFRRRIVLQARADLACRRRR